MTRSNSPEEPAFPVTLPAQAETALTAMVSTPGCDFAALARAAGLDPARDFRGADLRGVDFGRSDLSGFDFSGAELSGCDFSQAKLDAAITTGARRGQGWRFMELLGKSDQVAKLKYSTKGDLIVTLDRYGSISFWDGTTGIELNDSKTYQDRISNINFVDDHFPRLRHRVVREGSDSIKVRDLESYGIGELLPPIENCAFPYALSLDGSRVFTGDGEGVLRLWDRSSGKALSEPIHSHPAAVTFIRFSLDGKRVITAAEDGTVLTIDGWTGLLIGQPLRAHEGRVTALAFSPDGNKFAIGGQDGRLRVWHVATRQPIGEHISGPIGPVNSIAFSPDGSRFASALSDGKVIVWFLDPPVYQLFVTTRPEDESYKRKLLNKLFAHPEMMKRNLVESVLDPMTHPRPDEGARNALENSVAALFIVGDKDLAFMQHGELELARRLQRKTGSPRIIPVFTNSAIPTEPPDALKGYHFVHMPLDRPEAFNALVEAICQAVDNPTSALKNAQETEGTQTERDAPTTEAAYPTVKSQSRAARKQRIQINQDG